DDPGNPSVDFHGEKRRNDTHASTTDQEAKLARKSNNTSAKLSYSQHALMENRNGLSSRYASPRPTARRSERRRSICSRPRCRASGERPSVATRDSIPKSLSRNVVKWVSRRISHRTSPSGAALPSTGERLGIPAMRSASAFEKALRRYSAGSKRLAD